MNIIDTIEYDVLIQTLAYCPVETCENSNHFCATCDTHYDTDGSCPNCD